ncbi:MAG: histidine phosphatase family protein, partial [Candidatus Saccharimonadales bacterium]
MILLFVRHGETNSTILGMGEVVGNDDPLNQNGVNQAANAGNTCRSFSVKQIYSSPLV